MFARKYDYVEIEWETILEIELLPQLPPDVVEIVKEISENAVKSSCILMFILPLLQSGVLN